MFHVQKYKKQMLCLLFSCLLLARALLAPCYVYAQVIGETAAAAETEGGGSSAAETEGSAALLQLSSPSVVLMEASTGQIIYAKDADTRRSPASITKIMTLLLIFEALDKGTISLTDEVTTSAYAKSMGGSQVFLEEGEIQSVETLIKCIVVASGNDASVAMAEKIAGSEEAFVMLMNERAKQLGLSNTHFEDCCGLTDSDSHYTSAKDIALLSRELITKHPDIFNYTKIWMEDIVHKTARGESVFTLSSTNKLLKQYPYTTGLKTGSTSKAKYCFSATAEKDGISLIAVVMAAPDYKVRFSEAEELLTYGFSVCRLYQDENKEQLSPVNVKGGVDEAVQVGFADSFSYLDTNGADISQIHKEIQLEASLTAPVNQGDSAGKAVYSLDGKTIGEVAIVALSDVEKAVYKDYVKKVWGMMLL
jgi:D-alanyl-D-alanine carboxypeptidase (penicillin-binding protein 5/6)